MAEQHCAVGRAESNLVGRRWEMSAVEGLLDRAVDGHGAVVTVVGPPGIGKSRIVREVSAMAAARGVDVFTAFCESHASDIPFHVVARLLSAATGVGELEGPAARDRLAPTSRSIKGEQEEMATWSHAQLRAFLTWDRDTLGDDVHTLWWVIAHTGLRRSEALALRWSDVDLDGLRIKVRRALDTGLPAARRAEAKGTKSGRARVVDIDAETAKVLKRWRSERAEFALDFTRADAVVFGTLDGSSRNPMSVSQMFSRRVAKARKDLGSDALPVITLHDLRHTHASILLEEGVHPKVVQERLGHTTITTTMDTYSHVTPTMQRAAADRFAAAISGQA